MRGLLLGLALAAVLLAGGCSGDKPVATESDAQSLRTLQQDCSNPTWREQNLGLWYSVCRRPMHW